ncbi:SprB repeat-containing protein, partial [Tenacibaculum sp.]|nr:SprB repeat-containing protein [Tenacibaculum sp.]MDC1162112.1 SprB repeat-containing protein [Tenacibaculum sp.]
VEQPLLIEATYSHTNLTCFESRDGSINVLIKGGTNSYSYRLQKDNNVYGNWISFRSDIALSHLSKGLYNIQVKDTNDCYLIENGTIATLSFMVTQPELLTVNGTISHVTGFGLTNGSIITTIEGGTKPYTISWKDAKGIKLVASSRNLTTIGNGSYTILIKDSKGCSVNKRFIVTQPEELKVTLSQNSIVLCNGFKSAGILSNVTGGVKPYRYEWFVEDVSFNKNTSVNNVGAGNYYLTVTDANNNVTKSENLTITEPEVLKVVLDPTSKSCGGNNDWTVVSNITGGTPPYSYAWSSGEKTKDIKDVSEGSYFVVITDVNGCQVTSNILLETGSPLIITERITNVVCYNTCTGNIDLDIKGGIAPYSISWNTGETSASVNNLCKGDYEVTVKDQKGCSITRTISVKSAAEVVFDLVPNEVTLCDGETIEYDVTMSNVKFYKWTSDNGFTSTKSNVVLSEEGKYTLTITTNDGCTIARDIQIHKSGAEIDAQLILTSQAFVGEDIAIINVSNPISKNIEWKIPLNVEVVQKTNEGLVLRFPAPGNYEVSLVSTEGACKKIATKVVNVLKENELSDNGDSKKPFIKEFKVYSNPNKGKFKVNIELEKESEISLRLFSLGANSVVKERKMKGLKKYEVGYEMNASAGVYVLLLETSKARRIRKVIIE